MVVIEKILCLRHLYNICALLLENSNVLEITWPWNHYWFIFFTPICLCSLNGGSSACNYALIAAKRTDLVGAHLAANDVTTNPTLTSEHSQDWARSFYQCFNSERALVLSTHFSYSHFLNLLRRFDKLRVRI